MIRGVGCFVFADQTLTPREAVRLCALGTIAGGAMRYSELAASVRHFIGHISGPSLDLLAPSIELLRFEGLVAPVEGRGMEDDAVIAVTDEGQTEFRRLMTVRLRPSSDLTKLVTALKFRFLHQIPPEDQLRQADLLLETCENELARLLDLKGDSKDYGANFDNWLELEIAQAEARLDWIELFCRRIESQ